MAVVLVLKSSPMKNKSVSNCVIDEFVASYKKENPNDNVVTLDLSEMSMPHISKEIVDCWNEDGPKAMESKSLEVLCNQFVSADKYVIGCSHWNLMVNPCLVSYMVCVLRAGKAFDYFEHGAVGLLTDKKAQIILASGGVCQDADAHTRCYGEDWLRGVFSLCGVKTVDTLFVQGMEETPNKVADIVKEAKKAAKEKAKTF